jgi:capsular exopolysaccharide synthesis family protein
MGCAFAVALAFGFEYLDSRIRTPDEIKAHLGIPYLGLVPAVASKDMPGETPLLSNEVPPGFSEAMRAIRTAVVFSSAEEGARSIVITSTGPGEGKTVVSSNLGISLAQAGQRTILIDADMRRPRVHEVFGMAQEPGLSNVLVGTSDVDSILTTSSTPNLFVLGAGHLPPNPAELLGSKRYQALLADLRKRFDWVIIDAPPVMAVTDAAVVANGATGVVFVVGSEMTSRRNALAAIERLTAAKAHFIGGILNRADVQKHSYYYSTYYRKDYTQAYARTR